VSASEFINTFKDFSIKLMSSMEQGEETIALSRAVLENETCLLRAAELAEILNQGSSPVTLSPNECEEVRLFLYSIVNVFRGEALRQKCLEALATIRTIEKQIQPDEEEQDK